MDPHCERDHGVCVVGRLMSLGSPVKLSQHLSGLFIGTEKKYEREEKRDVQRQTASKTKRKKDC